MNKSFYESVNGEWIKNTIIPQEYSTWGTFSELQAKTQEKLKKILDNTVDENLSYYWKKGLNTRERDIQGLKPLHILFDKIDDISNIESLLVKLHNMGFQIGFSWSNTQNPENPKSLIGDFYPSSLGLPNKHYYMDMKYKDVFNDYRKFLKLVFHKLELPESELNDFLNLEYKLAKIRLSPEEGREPKNRIYIQNSLKNIESPIWRKMSEILPGMKCCKWNISDKKYFDEISNEFNNTPLKIWKTYSKVKIALAMSSFLPEEWQRLTFSFYGEKLKGQKKPKEIWKRLISILPERIGDRLAWHYCQENINKKDIAIITNMIHNIQDTFIERLDKNDWMTDKTKKEAIKKIKKLSFLIGHPKKWLDVDDLMTSITDGEYGENISFFDINLRVLKYEKDEEWNKIGRDVNYDKWSMFPYTVNAYYSPLKNQMVFPAAILQKPFYQDGDVISNYGGIGTVIAHEMTHALDDSGKNFNYEGKFINWWTEKDSKNFENKTKELVKQFNSYKIDGINLNGELTKGENVADLGGVAIALNALENELKIDKKELKQFFKAYAVTERRKTKKEYNAYLISNDPHAPSKFRVDGILPNIDGFEKAYPEYSENKNKKISIW